MSFPPGWRLNPRTVLTHARTCVAFVVVLAALSGVVLVGRTSPTHSAIAPALSPDVDAATLVSLLQRHPQQTRTGPPSKLEVATIATDKPDYQPGETAIITGEGFSPAELVELQVRHANGEDDGAGHFPFYATSDTDGRLTDQWHVDPDDSAHAIFILTARGLSSGREATTVFTDAVVEFIDQQADDLSGQRDLNFLQVDYGAPGASSVVVAWGWDDTAWSGNNTGDACSLFDTDGDGEANFAMCVTVKGIPAVYDARRLYSCSDGRSDRCTQPTAITTIATGDAIVTKDANSDPFGYTGSSSFDPAHATGNKCSNKTGAFPCVTIDTKATINVQLADVGGAGTAFLLNVCSYPSQEPNSDPSDCVIAPNNGFLRIVKNTSAATENSTFNFETTPQSVDAPSNGITQITTVNGTGKFEYLSFPMGSITVQELVPATWDLTAATCTRLDTNAGTGTPNFTGSVSGGTGVKAGLTGVSIDSGVITECVFTDARQNPTLKLVKAVTNDNNGTRQPQEWTLTANTTSFVYDTNINDWPTISLSPGQYTLGESGPAGYAQTNLVCSPGTGLTSNVLTLAAGENVTCTFTNNDQPGTLIVVKNITNDNGGDKVFSDFSFQVDGGSATAFEADGSNSLTVNAGTYTVTEPAVSGYTTTYNNCTNVEVSNGETETCTITNNDVAAELIVKKIVVNDNGGTRIATSFSFQVNGDTAVAFLQDTDTLHGKNTLSLDAGTYSVTEPEAAGYTTTYDNCSNLEIANGQSVTCTITNNDAKATTVLTTAMKWTLTDTATIANFRTGAATPGTIVFTLYKGTVCTDATLKHTTTVQNVTTGGPHTTPAGYAIDESEAGEYRWVAVYSGDEFNADSQSPCGDEVHTITVTAPQ